jgi:hypothetical protein
MLLRTVRSARTDADERRRSRRTRRIEGVALGLLAMLPVVPYVTSLLGAGVERYQLFGELARFEQATRHVRGLETWVGPWSELGWHQPGPLAFYLAAPLEALASGSGGASTGIFLAACLVNAFAAATLVFFARYYGRRAHAIAAMLGVLGWFLAFGSATANPQSSALAVLPLMAFVVCAALLARNRSSSIVPVYPAVFFGALAAETNIATLPTVLVCGATAAVGFIAGARRRGGLRPDERWQLAIAVVLLLVLVAPPLVEYENLSRLWGAFVAHRASPTSDLSIATQHWTTTTSLLPLRVVHRALAEDGAVPAMLSTAEMPHGVTPLARGIAFVHVVGVTVAAAVATRRGDLASLTLLGFGVLADVTGVLTVELHSSVVTREAVFWLTAASTVAWIGIASTLAMAAGSLADRWPRFTGFIVPTLIVVDLTAAVTATSLQRHWIARHPMSASSHPELATDLRALEVGLRERLEHDGTVAGLVVHRDGAREVADALVLELEKNGVALFYPGPDADVYAGGDHRRAADLAGPPDPLHVFVGTAGHLPAVARCSEPLARSGPLVLYGSRTAACVP